MLSRQLIKRAPKIELHAHLNGCVRRSTLLELAKLRNIEVDLSSFSNNDMESAFGMFGVIHKVLHNLQDIRRVTNEMLEDFLDQNVAYLEVRTSPKDCDKGLYTQEEYVSAISEEIVKFNQIHGNIMQTRLILSIDRSRSLKQAQQTFDILLNKQNKYPYHIVTQDHIDNSSQKLSLNEYSLFVGMDYSGNPLKNTFKDFLPLFERARLEGFKTTVHVAEMPGDVCLQETIDILQFSPDRLGHFNYFNAELQDIVLKKGIPIEMCPTSNMYTMGLKNMEEHHFKIFFDSAHPLSLNTDDTCVFDTNSTIEHTKMVETFNLSKSQFQQLLLTSSDIIFDTSLKLYLRQKINHFFSTYEEDIQKEQ